MTKQYEIDMLKRQNADLWYKLDKAYAKIERLEEELAYCKDSNRFYKNELEHKIERLENIYVSKNRGGRDDWKMENKTCGKYK